MVVNKIYTEKYELGNLGAGSRASVSAALCEKTISIISSAQESLSHGDKLGWAESLAKIPHEMGALISAINTPELGGFGHEMQLFYTKISFHISDLVMGAEEASRADHLIEKLCEARDIWHQLHIKYMEGMESAQPQNGSLL